jgi:cation:H+ antiporter
MLGELIGFAVGLAMLYFSASWLVGGAAGLARRLGVPALVIGLTIVAFGTSAPELMVSVRAAIDGRSDIVLGNVVGSNIVNIALILGIAALIRPLTIHIRSIRAEAPVMIGAVMALILFSIDAGLGRIEGVLLVIGLILFIFYSYRTERSESTGLEAEISEEMIRPAGTSDNVRRNTVMIIVGIAGLALGAHLFVESSVSFARYFGVSEKFIGLTVVAAGTSLPELATSVVAAMKGETDISVGNIIGSNIFNILAILGLSAVVSPITVGGGLSSAGYLWDYTFLLALSVFIWLVMMSGMKITRTEGILLIGSYFGYLVWLSVRL